MVVVVLFSSPSRFQKKKIGFLPIRSIYSITTILKEQTKKDDCFKFFWLLSAGHVVGSGTELGTRVMTELLTKQILPIGLGDIFLIFISATITTIKPSTRPLIATHHHSIPLVRRLFSYSHHLIDQHTSFLSCQIHKKSTVRSGLPPSIVTC